MRTKKITFCYGAWKAGDISAFRFMSEGEENYYKEPKVLAFELSFATEAMQTDEMINLTAVYVFPFDPVVVGDNIDEIVVKFDKAGIQECKLNGEVIPLSSIKKLRLVINTVTRVYVLKKGGNETSAWELAAWKKLSRNAIQLSFVELQQILDNLPPMEEGKA